MKRLILVVAGLIVVAGAGLYRQWPRTSVLSVEEHVAELPPVAEVPASDQVVESLPAVEQVASTKSEQNSETSVARPANRNAGREPGQPAPGFGPVCEQMIEILLSPESNFEQRQAAWKRLKEAGQLDLAIARLEQRAVNDPGKAENAAALGEAYLKKAGAIEDMRQKAILAMKADETLELALSLDPSNWEARYIKAVGMSYWP